MQGVGKYGFDREAGPPGYGGREGRLPEENFEAYLACYDLTGLMNESQLILDVQLAL